MSTHMTETEINIILYLLSVPPLFLLYSMCKERQSFSLLVIVAGCWHSLMSVWRMYAYYRYSDWAIFCVIVVRSQIRSHK